MNCVRARICVASLGLTFLLAGGCSQQPAPPKPISVDQAPTSLAEAFKTANPQAKELANDATSAMTSKDFPKALFALQSLSGRSDLTPDQRDLAARSLLAVNQALQEQAGNGDQQAQQALQMQRIIK
jgi:hypothetical protein